jgi:hypothetical protein
MSLQDSDFYADRRRRTVRGAAVDGCAMIGHRLTAIVFAALIATVTEAQRPPDESARVLSLTPGVTATIVAPADHKAPTDLIFYALPNGNSTAETMGRALRADSSVGWRYDIQHIAAQTRALRTRGLPGAVVVYLEADGKSWPSWRAKLGYPAANARIVAMLDSMRHLLGDPPHITLTGHSGGGSLMFGFIEGQSALPGWLERIAFLDALYNFDAATHGEKLLTWLHGDPKRMLVSLAYDDREIMLDGKKVVSDARLRRTRCPHTRHPRPVRAEPRAADRAAAPSESAESHSPHRDGRRDERLHACATHGARRV